MFTARYELGLIKKTDCLSSLKISSVVVKALRYKSDGPGTDSPVVSLDFSVTYFLPTKPWPWGRLSP